MPRFIERFADWVASFFADSSLTEEQKQRCEFIAKFGPHAPGDEELFKRYLRERGRQIEGKG